MCVESEREREAARRFLIYGFPSRPCRLRGARIRIDVAERISVSSEASSFLREQRLRVLISTVKCIISRKILLTRVVVTFFFFFLSRSHGIILLCIYAYIRTNLLFLRSQQPPLVSSDICRYNRLFLRHVYMNSFGFWHVSRLIFNAPLPLYSSTNKQCSALEILYYNIQIHSSREIIEFKQAVNRPNLIYLYTGYTPIYNSIHFHLFQHHSYIPLAHAALLLNTYVTRAA